MAWAGASTAFLHQSRLWHRVCACVAPSADPAGPEDLAEIDPYLAEYCAAFGLDKASLLDAPFTVVTPDSANPYRQMYVAN